MSPRASSFRDTGVPSLYCFSALWGSDTPARPYTYITRPEQSKPRGSAPPQRYGAPTCANANATTRDARSTGAADTTGADRFGSPVERHPATITDKPQSAIAKTVTVVDMAVKARPQRRCRGRVWSQLDTNTGLTIRCVDPAY